MLKPSILTLSLICATAMANPDITTTVDLKPFKTTMQGELTNRATARYAIAAITARDLEQDAKQFWHSYAALEALNQVRYAPVAAELQLKPSALSAWLKGRSASLYYRFFPESMLKTMAKSTDSYYRELSDVTAKVAAQHRTFYMYVLEQEQAQVEALALAAAGKYREASVRLDEFIQAHQPKP
jgi:hypothetical protein